MKGTVQGFSFIALVFSEQSEYGINQGRVSKLFMEKANQRVLVYDRKWDIEPTEQESITAFNKLLSGLEALPE
ncbi:MAG: hypothetical protein EOO01_39650 [Chitinophagaceae bacterium]|nr:MAG: hypothetical protein EOO01_39650 [Chitinophagaceae bacterium]